MIAQIETWKSGDQSHKLGAIFTLVVELDFSAHIAALSKLLKELLKS